MSTMINAETIYKNTPIMPVMVIEKIEDAIPLAKALSEGGINTFEITLRTDCALDAIKLISEHFPQAYVGAGTILNEQQFDQAVAAGANFVVTPGTPLNLLDHAAKSGVAFIPGVTTVSEVVAALGKGFKYQKFFPAEANGGVKTLKAISGPVPQVQFCPTGGINAGNVAAYLKLASVGCVGGTWMLPAEEIRAGNWAEITRLTRAAVELVSKGN